MPSQVSFSGVVLAVQPRVMLHRSFDQRHEEYLGYVLRVSGHLDGRPRAFLVGLSEADQERAGLQAGDHVEGQGALVHDRRTEISDIDRVTGLRAIARASGRPRKGPPKLGVPVPLDEYRDRGFRRLDERTFETKCDTCVWACEMAVEMIIDHWNRGAPRRSASGPSTADVIALGRHARSRGARAWSTKRRTGSTRDATGHREDDE
jgi:hypothetical protein